LGWLVGGPHAPPPRRAETGGTMRRLKASGTACAAGGSRLEWRSDFGMGRMSAGSHIVLGVTGSIAAYKAAELVRLMVKKDWDVSVVMTEAAKHFVTELTFRTLSRNPVAVEMFPESPQWMPEHIALADRADVLCIAPCTANVLAKLAQGLADDQLTCAALACKAPLVIAPAMNANMWEHPATRVNVDLLEKRGGLFVECGTGELACGWEGRGRMADPETILAAVTAALP
jgi:phosphopantothenoylcysteine synthetase/decarboxylase